MHSRTSPPSFAANVLYHPETFFFRARDGDPPHICNVEASEGDALQLLEIFTGSPEKEVFGRLGWNFFHTPSQRKKTPVERPWPVRPGVLAICNAFADEEDVYIYLQTWRQRYSSQVEQQVGPRAFAPLQAPGLRGYIKDMIELAWTESSIISGEETQIVHIMEYKETSEDGQSISENGQSI